MTDIQSLECPTNLPAFTKLMEEHGDHYFSWDDLSEAAQQYLREHCLPGRRLVTLSDLLIFVEGYHKHWYDILQAVTQALKNRHVLPCEYEPSVYFWEPETDVPDDRFVSQ